MKCYYTVDTGRGLGGLQEEEEDEGRGGDSRRAEEDGNTREVRRSDGRGWRGVGREKHAAPVALIDVVPWTH